MTKGPFDDLFGMWFNQFGNNFDEDPRATSLIKTFRTEIRKGDKEFLKKIVVKYEKEVYGRTSNLSLLESYSVASVCIEDLEKGYESLSKIKTPNILQEQAMGLIAYSMEEYGKAVNHLKDSSGTKLTPSIVFSLSLFREGDSDIEKHSKNLESFLDESAVANTLLGTLYFNSRDIAEAEKYFEKAAEKSPNSESVRLNLMRSKLANGNQLEVYKEMNSFYIDTNSSLSKEELDKELNKSEINMPHLKITNLYKILASLFF
ncbi:MAG: tetratricopeptide repeat protein [Nanoarchaeota archaeon]